MLPTKRSTMRSMPRTCSRLVAVMKLSRLLCMGSMFCLITALILAGKVF